MPEHDEVKTHPMATRRTLLRGALIAGAATPLLAACGSSSDSASGTPAGASTSSSGGGTSSDSGGGSSSSAGGRGGSSVIAQTSDVPKGSGIKLDDPGIVITQPRAGDFKGFTNICTHLGCPIFNVTKTINCNCHGSQYSIKDGSVVTGPATQGLADKPITVSGKDISLA